MRSLRRAGLRLIAGQPRGGGEPAPQIRHDYGLGTIMGRAYLAGGRTTGRTPTTVPGSPPAGADRRRALAVPGRRCRRRPARLRHLRHFLLLSAGVVSCRLDRGLRWKLCARWKENTLRGGFLSTGRRISALCGVSTL